MTERTQNAKTKIRNLLDTVAENLSREEYRELLDEIAADCDGRIECLNDGEKALAVLLPRPARAGRGRTPSD